MSYCQPWHVHTHAPEVESARGKRVGVCSWLKMVSEGYDQEGDVFWDGVKGDLAHVTRQSPSTERSADNCRHHWTAVNRKVKLFHQCWPEVQRIYLPGRSNRHLMKIVEYADRYNHEFVWHHWWMQVLEQPHWLRP